MPIAERCPGRAPTETERYAGCIDVSRRIRWDIDRDVIRGRTLDFHKRFLPENLARVGRLHALDSREQRLLSQVQGRTYANMFSLAERFIGAKMLQISSDHWFGDQVALEALVRLADDELKHQALFRRIDGMAAQGMPTGYTFQNDPNDVAHTVMAASSWAVLALACHVELFTQVHYRASIEPDPDLSALFKDVFLFHWKEESQHAVLDELEWRREDSRLSAAERDRAVDELIGLLHAMDGVLQGQARADAGYFLRAGGRRLAATDAAAVEPALLGAYRWQYIDSGLRDARFQGVLGSMITPAQGKRIHAALAAMRT
jgi:hypothetical protein